MIPIAKLERLPRHQRLRKILKLFDEVERHPGIIAANFSQIKECITLLTRDELFSTVQSKEIAQCAAMYSRICDAMAQGSRTAAVLEPEAYIRIINSLRHILLNVIGQQVADWDLIDHDGLLDPHSRKSFPGTAVYLEDIRSPFNVGAIFRTAESFGIEQIFLSPFCADPSHPRSLRTAMGCIDMVPHAQAEVSGLPGPVFAMETGGTPLRQFSFPRTGTLIVGSEELGVSPESLVLADKDGGRVSIPCYGAKGSLNVSVAFGIVMQAWAVYLASSSASGNGGSPV
jgi:TrmH family RNA methyltransferase